MKKMLVLAVALAGALAVPVAPVVAAPSPPLVLVDGSGDVWTFSDTTVGYTPATRPEADVLRARVTPAAHTLVIRQKFSALEKGETAWYRARVRAPGGTTWYVLEAAKGHWTGKLYQEIQGEWVAEKQATSSIDYAKGIVRIVVPYAAIGSPAWVQVRLENTLGLKDHNTFFTDNPLTHTAKPGWTDRLDLR